jgi:hypothetical protein
MEMCTICSPELKQIVMLFNLETIGMSDDKLLLNLPKFVRKSEHYDNFKLATDLSVSRVALSIDDKIAAKEAGDLLYSFLANGYTCLGNYIGRPNPDMSHHGILTVLRRKGMGFYIKTD